MPHPLRASPARRASTWAAVAVVLVALNLRGPLVAIAPVAGQVRSDLAVTAGAVGLLTTLPVLCFGVAAPLASALIARAGLHRSVLVCLGGTLAGELLRSAGGYPAALAGTLVIGAAITVGNIAVPVLIAEDFPTAVGVVTALYTAAFNVGSTLTSALTPVLAAGVGWRTATAVWGVLALTAAVAGVQAQRLRGSRERSPADRHDGGPAAAGTQGAEGPEAPVRASPWRRPGTWGLVLAFAGQSFAYYGTTAWLPQLLGDEIGLAPEAAGGAASLFQVFAIAGAFGVPALLRLTRRPRVGLWAVCALWLVLPVGLIAAPRLWPLWCAAAGAAQGGGLVVVFVAVAARSPGTVEARRTSALVQGGGYVLGATGPLVVGAAHDVTGAWTAPLLVVVAAVVLLLVAGTGALPGRDSPAGTA